jgi:HK97 family phage major capsid protein
MPQTTAERIAEIRTELRLMEERRVTENRDFTEPESQRAIQLVEEREQLSMTRTTPLTPAELRHARIQESLRDYDPNHVPSAYPAGGFDKKWDKRYSLLRAIDLCLQGKPVDGYEGEVSQEIAKRAGSTPRGFYVPMSLPMGRGERRDLDTTSGAGAVQQSHLNGRFIDVLRNRSVLLSLGATLLDGLTGDVAIPKQTAGGNAYWIAEAGAPTESSPTIGQVLLQPKTVGAYVDVTRKLIKQTSLDIEMMVRRDLTQVLGIELDRVGSNGSGVGAEPEGILQNDSITTVAIGDDGGDPTWAKVVELESVVATANADVRSMAYLTSNYGRGKLKSTEKGSSGYPYHLWSENNTVNGHRAVSTSQIPSDLTKGEGEDLTALIFGDFSSLVFGTWGGIDVNFDPMTFSNTGAVRIVALMDTCVKFRRVESFAKIVDMNRA